MSAIQASHSLPQFVRFIVAGGIAACVNIGIRIPFGWIMPYSVSIVAAYLVGMTTAFLLARLFVFDATHHSTTSEYLRFTVVNLISLAQVWLISIGLDKMLFPWLGMTWHSPTVAHIIGVASPVLTSYYGHKWFSFRGALSI
jgi:putative flippase GtrA